ncbi:hypothetical protein D4764_11G0000060 [Takifugu flavidus]|uniref:Uncharacterized protein n=1 Tax=Takifugu flavidus TaxID=433684 RepID=A0A5C6PEW7_9TELE|nr:hypothetical protein D4764_11G0000060 [Takifugu flavidus]
MPGAERPVSGDKTAPRPSCTSGNKNAGQDTSDPGPAARLFYLLLTTSWFLVGLLTPHTCTVAARVHVAQLSGWLGVLSLTNLSRCL